MSMNSVPTSLRCAPALLIGMAAILSPSFCRAEPAVTSAAAAEDVLAPPASLAAWDYQFTPDEERLLDEIQRGCFNYFWKEVGAPAYLAKDKTSDTVASIAAVGFQLSSLPIGVERGWITREAGEERALAILRALVARKDNKKFGFYLHFLDENTAGQPDYSRTRYPYELQASTVDHAILQAGAMTAASYFGGEVAKAAQPIVDDANWRKMYDEQAGFMTMGWKAKTPKGVAGPGEIKPAYWQWCSDEERLVDFLAVGAAPEHAVGPQVYYRLKRNLQQHDDMPPYVISWNGSLFTYFFAHCWIDYRHMAADNPGQFGVDAPRVDWFENSRRAVLTHRERCLAAANDFPTFGSHRWGLAPCEFRNDYLVAEVRPNISDRDDWRGAIVAPYAAGSAIMFAPAECLAALREMRELKAPDGQPLAWRDPAMGGYGFVDSFSLDPPHGHTENLGIDQGPMLLAIENVRTGLIWKLFMQHEATQRAVERLKLEPRKAIGEEPKEVRRAG